MRHLIQLFTICCLVATAFAGDLDRTKPPAPGPAPQFKMGTIHQFTADNGLQVYVVERHKTPMVTFNLILDVDPVLQGDAVGYVDAAGLMLMRGTKTYDKLALDKAIDAIGATITPTETGMTGTSLSRYKDEMMRLMADMIINSDFKQEELDKIVTQLNSALQQATSDPGEVANRVRSTIYYGKDHPYGEIQTEETIANISLDKVKNYYQTYYKPNVSHLAMVGDITLKEAKTLVNKHLAAWQKGDVPSHTYEVPKPPAKTMVAVVDRPGAVQTVLSLGHPVVLKPGPPNTIPANLTVGILGGSGGRLYDNLREDKGYTYGAYAAITADPLVSNFTAFAQVRTEVTQGAATEFFNELKRIRDEQVPQEELETRISMNTGAYARTLEDPAQLGTFAIDTNRFNLPKDYYANYLQYLAEQTPASIQATAQYYVQPDNMWVLAVGNGEEIEKALSGFGEIVHFDANGNRIEKSNVALPEGLTASKVIDTYIKAVGGVDNIKAVEDMEMAGTMTVQGMPLEMNLKFKAPNRSLITASMNGQPAFKKVFDGTQGYQIQMGNKTPYTEEEITEEKIDSHLVPEMVFAEMGVKTELTAAEEIDGSLAYKVKVTYPSGKVKQHYFDAESGLKVRTIETRKTPQGEVPVTINFSDIRDVQGLKWPHAMEQVFGPMTMKMNFNEPKFNQGLDEALFNAGS